MSECGSRRNTFYRLCVRVPFCRRSARPFFYPDVSLRWLSSACFTSCGVRCVRFVRHFGRMDHVFTKDYSRPCLRPYYTNSKSLLRCFSGHPRSYLPVLSIYNEHISCDTTYIEDFFFYKSFTGCFLIRHKYTPVYGCILTAIVCTRIQVHFRRTAKCVHEKHKPGYPAQTYRYRFTRSSRFWLRHPRRTCKPIFSWLLPPQFPTGSPCLYVSEEKPGVRYHGSREIYFHAQINTAILFG